MEKTYRVEGLSCASCAMHAEKAVQKLIGVQKASVNFATAALSVSFDESKVTAEDFKKAVSDAGYTLIVPEENAADDGEADKKKEQRELRVSRIKLIVAAAFTIPLLYVAMGPMIGLPVPFFLDPAAEKGKYAAVYALVQLFLTLPVLAAGYQFYTVGFKAIVKRAPNMDSLIAIGTLASLAYSIYSLIRILAGDHHAAHELYFETAAGIVALILLGRFLEAGGRRKTYDAIRKLAALAPATAIIFAGGQESEIPIAAVKTGDILVIKPGGRIPADGTVTDGGAVVDESMLTGESMPVYKKAGDPAYAATVNQNGVLYLRVEKTGADTALGQIIRLVGEAQGRKAPIAKIADKVSGFFVPAVILIAAVAFVGWMLAGEGFAFSLKIFVAVLVVACPCALGLATPLAIMVGTGIGAESGILFKGGDALEAAHKIDTVVFDKTGTITAGRPDVTDIFCADGVSETELLRLAASAEKGSEHPLSAAIVRAAADKQIVLEKAESFAAVAGLGISAFVGNQSVLIGSRKLTEQEHIAADDVLFARAKQFSSEGKTPVFVAADGTLKGLLAVADTVKPDAAAAVARLKQAGYAVAMLTGDNEHTARAVAASVGIDEVLADVLPGEKAAAVEAMRAAGKKVAFVGDGINDAPALSSADSGIAVGSGTDVAIESADIVLVKNDLSAVCAALSLSKKTMRNIKQNLFWAFFYNALGIPVAAGLLYAFGGPLLSPMLCAAAMVLSDLSLLLNVLRLKLTGGSAAGQRQDKNGMRAADANP